MKHRHEHTVTLVENAFCRIESCACGMIHLHMGPFSLRLTEKAFRNLFHSLHEGLQAHEHLQASRKPDIRLVT